MLRLPYRPPYDWAAIRAFLAKRAIPGVEMVDPGGATYARTVSAAGRHGFLTVEPGDGCLHAALRGIEAGDAPTVAGRLRSLFDCDADPTAIAACLARDPVLAPLVAARPGLRLPGAWDPFETGCRAILGQQVSVAAAIGLAGTLVAAFGTPLAEPAGGLTHIFPAPAALVEADVARVLNMPRARGAAIRALAAAALADPDLFAPAETLEAAVLRFTVDPRDRTLDGAVHRHAGAQAAGRPAGRRCRPAAGARDRHRTPEPGGAARPGRGVAPVSGLRGAASLGGGRGGREGAMTAPPSQVSGATPSDRRRADVRRRAGARRSQARPPASSSWHADWDAS